MSAFEFRLLVALITLAIVREAESTDAKVLILGGGAAGLNAAQSLYYKGENDFIILEAQDEFGGRVQHVRFANKIVERGANWIHPPRSKLEEIAQTIQLATKLSNFDDMLALNGEAVDVTAAVREAQAEFDSKLEEALVLGRKYIDDDKMDMSLRAGLRYVGWKPETPEDNVAEWMHTDLQLGDGPERVSFLAHTYDKLYESDDQTVVGDSNSQYYKEDNDLILVADDDYYNYKNIYYNDRNGNNDGSFNRRRRQTYSNTQSYFVIDKDGYKSIFNETMSFLKHRDSRDKILYNKVVDRIDYSRSDQVTVYCKDGSTYTAEYVLVTFSLGVLQSDLVEFKPSLPLWKTDYWNRFEMAAYTKIFLNFRDDDYFWENSRNEWIVNVDPQRKGYWPLFLNFEQDDLFGKDKRILMAILTGDEARRVEGLTEAQIKSEARSVLNKMYDRYDVPSPISILVSNWIQNPYTLGSHSLAALGSELDCFTRMESRVDRVFFAGEATSQNNTGYVLGALESGKREGLKIYYCLQGISCPEWNTKTKCGCDNGATGVNTFAVNIILGLVMILVIKRVMI